MVVTLASKDWTAALGVSATLGRVTVGVDLARVAHPISVMTLRLAPALTRVDQSLAATSGMASAALGRVIVGAELDWAAPPSSTITPRMRAALVRVVPGAAMAREVASTTVE